MLQLFRAVPLIEPLVSAQAHRFIPSREDDVKSAANMERDTQCIAILNEMSKVVDRCNLPFDCWVLTNYTEVNPGDRTNG